MKILPYLPEHEAAWDKYCAGAVNATLLHTRRFLSYHGERFKDSSVLIVDSDRIVGIFPAATSPTDPSLVISHPGATYGGLVHHGWLTGMRMIEALTALCEYYVSRSYRRLLYKPTPHIYANAPAQDDLYALFRLGAQLVRCELSCAIDLAKRQPPSERRRRGLRKAKKTVTLSSDPSLLGELWEVITNNLVRRHQARPVHTLGELDWLMGRFPQEIPIHCALLEGRVEAGVVFFNSLHVWHAQYIASTERGHHVSALDAVFEAAIAAARSTGASFFDFGTSNENGGKVLNEGLYRFKSEFGGGGVAHQFLELGLGIGAGQSREM
jgi:hypothetical protein